MQPRAIECAPFAGHVVYVGITQQNLDLPHAPVTHRRESDQIGIANYGGKESPPCIAEEEQPIGDFESL